jgi:hypothetical protein
MKATKFFKLKALWESKKQPVVVEQPKPEPKLEQPVKETITPVVEEVKQEQVDSISKAAKKKVTNEE